MHAEAERALRPARRRTSTRAARRSASRSPTSRSSRSPRPSRSTRALLIMDEPTAALSGVEVERLFAVARSLRDEGRALVFISHRFDEVFALCDTVTVMRDGAYVSTDRDRRHHASTRSSRRMVGREVGDLFPKTAGRDRRRRSSRSQGLEPRRRLPRRLLHGPRRRDRRPRRPRRRRAAARSPAPSSASTRYDAGLGPPGRPAGPGARPRAPRSGPAWRSSPRTAASRAWSSRRSVARNVAGVIRGGLAKAGLLTSGAENGPPRPGPRRLEVKTSALDMTRRAR